MNYRKKGTASFWRSVGNEFAKNARKSGRYVEAYRANFDTLFPSKTKKKRTSFPTKLLFGNKSLISDAVNPFKLKKPSKYDEEFGRVSNAPVIIGTLSTVNQQLSMIDSLTTDLMLHLCRLNSDTVFKYGSVQLITFLTAGNYAMLLSSIEPSLKFLARAFRHRSWFINKIFNIRPIVNMKRIHRNAFQPHFPLQKTIAHEKKLADLNISNGFLYGITIQPKEAISIGAMNLLSYDSYDNCEEFDDVADVLMKYAFWTKITGKLTINCKLLSKLREWFPHRETDFASFISDETKLSQLSMQTLDEMFVVIYKFLAEEECTIRKEIEEFTSKFKPVPADKKFAD
ncbi:unnamed protein product [Dracunculus medinensis]|uniref:39S ribosomal protein L28, mitochondrial n=1 Tax=Dracunculus medinensis TaxID=318479 RepID=A0A158Q4K7_DRAME|nr:unnamed protein product [Dracunculus medinensis]